MSEETAKEEAARQEATKQEATRSVSDAIVDDVAIPFAIEALDARGRIVRLGPAIDALLANHAYPEPVARLVGEAAVLTVLLGSSMREKGQFQLQTRSNGVVDMLVVDFDAPGGLRAFARFDPERLAAAQAEGKADPKTLLGRGHLAFTIEPGDDNARYQGVVALEGEGLQAAAHDYFERSEQIPTLVRLAVGEEISGAGAGAHWRAGGLIVQYLPEAEERRRDYHPGGEAPAKSQISSDQDSLADASEDAFADAWTEALALGSTVEDHELLDSTLSGERLLYRLFHERGVRVYPPQPIEARCRCSTPGVKAMLQRFTPQERADMVGDDGKIGVTCEFCSTKREFDPKEFV